MALWTKGGETAGAGDKQAKFPEHVYNRRQQLEPDIKFGQMEVWVGVGRNQAWPWLDVAVRVGKGWGVFLDIYGGFIKRPDFLAFVPAFRAFVEGAAEEAQLRSFGGSMRLKFWRQHGRPYGEAEFQHAVNSQTVRFQVWDDALREAAIACEAAAARIEAVSRGWLPKLRRHNGEPRAAMLETPQPPSEFKTWESGLGEGGDVRFDYEIDGYGWYGVRVQVGDDLGEFGGGWLTDALGDLLRAALMLLAGKKHAEVLAMAEPGQTRLEFETVQLRTDPPPELGVPGKMHLGCWIRIRELDHHDGSEKELLFEALARSRRAVAEAIYAMALPHFVDGAGPWSEPMAALEGALATVPREEDD